MASDEELGTGSVTIVLDESGVTAAADQLGDRLERTLDRASRDAGLRMQRNITRAVDRISPVRVRVEADLRAFGHSVDTLANFPPVQIPVTPDVNRARFEAAIQATLDGLEVSVRVVPDMDGFDAAIRAHHVPDINVNVNADRSSLGRLSGAIGGIGRSLKGVAGGAKLATIGIAAASSAQGVLALGAALAPTAGLLAAGPAAILGYQAALGGLKLALSGVSDAFKAGLTGDAKAFEKTLEGLSPKAQAAAREVRALKPAFEALRSTVQDSFFSRIEGEITATAQALGGPLKSQLSTIGGAWGQAARNVLQYVRSTDGVNNVSTILKATGTSLTGLAAVTDDVSAGFLQVASSVAKAFGTKTSSVITDVGNKLSAFLIRIADNGQAVQWVSDAIVVFRHLGAIASNIAGVIGNVFKAAENVGGGLLNNLQQLTQAMQDFTGSAEGQEAIGNIFATVSTIAAQLAPILGALVSTLGQVAPALGPLFETIGPAIASTIEALGPAIAGILPGVQAVVTGIVGALDGLTSSGALTAIGAAFGAILTAIAPLLPVVGVLVGQLVSALAPALTAIAEAAAPVIAALSAALLPVLPVLAGAIGTIVTALTPLVEILGATLANIVVALSPLLGTLAALIAQIATAVAPLIIQLTDALVPVFEQLAPLVATLVAALVPLVTALVDALLPVLPPIIEAVIALFNAVVPLIEPLVNLTATVLGFATTIITALAPVLQFVAGVVSWTAINVVTPIIQTVVNVVATIADVLSFVISAVSSFVPTVISFFRSLASTIASVVSSFVSGVIGFFARLASTVIATVSSFVSGVIGFFAALPGRAVSAVSSIVSSMSAVFVSARNAVVAKVTSLVADAITLVRGLPGKAAAALAGLGGVLVSAGASLIQGLINGITSKIGEVKSKLGDLTSKLTDWKGPANRDARILTPAGKSIIEGLIRGFDQVIPDVRSRLEKLTTAIRDAFRGKNTRVDDVLIRQVQATEKQLLTLAKRREAIADRIKKANEFAASTATAAAQTGSLQTLGVDADGVKGITFGIEQAAAKIRKFNAQVAALAKRGLSKNLLGQLIGLGPDQGAAQANAFSKATGAQLKDLNAAQTQLDKAAKTFGATSADVLFDAGKAAGLGLLSGLKAQQKEIGDLMVRIARQMANSIRSALKIHSPSRVFRGIGVNTMDGLSLGVQDRIAAVRRTAVGAASALTGPFSGDASLGTLGSARGRQRAVQGDVTNSRTVSPTINVYEVGNAQATAERIIQRLVTAGGL